MQGKGGLVVISVTTQHANATISLHGGQVLSYTPIDNGRDNENYRNHDLLFVSNNAYFQNDKAIKGGAPICWPWFAAHKEDETLPFHGFVRDQAWQVHSTECSDNGDVVITLVFNDTEKTRKLWPYSFELKEVITVGTSLGIDLITHNTSTQAFDLTQAIHTYFRVGDITQVKVTGLEGKSYLDKVEQFAVKNQTGPITVNQEVDRIYQQVDSSLVIHDEVYNRNILIEHTGSATAVVWNPWVEISEQSQDLKNDSYQHFICVETANAADDIITIAADETHTLGVEYHIQNQ